MPFAVSSTNGAERPACQSCDHTWPRSFVYRDPSASLPGIAMVNEEAVAPQTNPVITKTRGWRSYRSTCRNHYPHTSALMSPTMPATRSARPR